MRRLRLMTFIVGSMLFVAGLVYAVWWISAPEGVVIEFSEPWIRAVEQSALPVSEGQQEMDHGSMSFTASGVFLIIENNGRVGDRLVRAETEVADKVELHSVANQGGVSMMFQTESIPVPARSRVVLKPGSFHIMLIGVNQPLDPGMQIPVRLVFEKTGPVDVMAQVRVSE